MQKHSPLTSDADYSGENVRFTQLHAPLSDPSFDSWNYWEVAIIRFCCKYLGYFVCTWWTWQLRIWPQGPCPLVSTTMCDLLPFGMGWLEEFFPVKSMAKVMNYLFWDWDTRRSLLSLGVCLLTPSGGNWVSWGSPVGECKWQRMQTRQQSREEAWELSLRSLQPCL